MIEAKAQGQGGGDPVGAVELGGAAVCDQGAGPRLLHMIRGQLRRAAVDRPPRARRLGGDNRPIQL